MLTSMCPKTYVSELITTPEPNTNKFPKSFCSNSVFPSNQYQNLSNCQKYNHSRKSILINKMLKPGHDGLAYQKTPDFFLFSI